MAQGVSPRSEEAHSNAEVVQAGKGDWASLGNTPSAGGVARGAFSVGGMIDLASETPIFGLFVWRFDEGRESRTAEPMVASLLRDRPSPLSRSVHSSAPAPRSRANTPQSGRMLSRLPLRQVAATPASISRRAFSTTLSSRAAPPVRCPSPIPRRNLQLNNDLHCCSLRSTSRTRMIRGSISPSRTGTLYPAPNLPTAGS